MSHRKSTARFENSCLCFDNDPPPPPHTHTIRCNLCLAVCAQNTLRHGPRAHTTKLLCLLNALRRPRRPLSLLISAARCCKESHSLPHLFPHLAVTLTHVTHVPTPQVVVRDLLPAGTVWIDCVFKDSGRVLSFFAKRARGLMARWCALHCVESPEELKAFDLEGYKFVPKESSDTV
jgi:hypothetical protein